MQSNNQQAFLALVSAGLWTENEYKEYRDSGVSEPIEWESVYLLSEEQSLFGVVLSGIERISDELRPPQAMLLQWIGEVHMLEQKNKAMNGFIAKLMERLRTAGVNAILVKGQGIAQCYEKPLWRVCGDVDLLLDKENYEKAKTLLAPLATSVEKEYVEELHLGMTLEGWIVELHGTLHSGLSSKIEKGLEGICESIFYDGRVRSWKNDQTILYLPRADEDVVYVFTHILQHFYKGGIGLRQICDWCRLLWTYRDSLNHGLLESRIRKMGLMSEWKAFGAFAVEYLGMPQEAMPLLNDNHNEDEDENDNNVNLNANLKRKAERILEFVMEVGNMGHNRDSSYSKYPYIVRKAYSFGRRCSDLWRHARIFPLDSFRFMPTIMSHGIQSAMRGE